MSGSRVERAGSTREHTRPEGRRSTVYVVPHTHWDREWYLPFESFRVRLVDVIDRLLETMSSDGDYRVFTLDGQTIVLNDYLDVRPEREDTLRELIVSKRVRIGPWHVLADEFLVSPEALIRNLAEGARICAEFGDRLEVMYTPDSFGHISQLPLMAAEFGLDAIVFERGVGDEGERLRGEFLWRSADGGREVFAHHLVTTYSSAAAIGHADWEMADDYDPDRAARHARAALFGSDGVDLDYLPDWFRASLGRVAGGAAEHAVGRALLLLNGSDHLYAQGNVPQLIRDLQERIPEVDFVHADLEAFIDGARASAGDLATYQGEFRGSRYQHVLSGVLSSRMYLKQANAAAETRLEKYTEPLCALAWLAGGHDPRPLIRHAWSTLLENHPHDSICGCSVDAVHDAMMVRFARVHHLAEPLERRAVELLAARSGAGVLAVFHPHPFPTSRVLDVEVPLPDDLREPIELVDDAGGGVAASIRYEREPAPGRTDGHVTRALVTFRAELSGLGITTYRLRAAGERAAQGTQGAQDARFDAAAGPGIGAGTSTEAGSEADAAVRTESARVRIENDMLRLDVDPDGDLTLLHKSSGARWPLDLRFEDDADAGDSYDFSPLPHAPRMIRTPSIPPRVIEQGPLRSTVRVDYRAEIPEQLSADRTSREGSVSLPIALELTLDAGRPSLGLRVRVDNRARDHRLRLCIATGRDVEHVYAEGHFDILRRPVDLPGGPHWFQVARGTNHQRRFVAAHDGERGVAVLNRGLPEYEATRSRAGGLDVAVTLLRCVGWLSRDDLASRPQGAGPALPTPGAQCPGRHEFELAVMPLVGADPWPSLMREADLFAARPSVHFVAPRSGKHGDGADDGGRRTAGLLELPEPLVMTALKVADARDALIVRIWNPSPNEVDATIPLGFAPSEAHAIRFDETRLHRIECAGRMAHISIPARDVRTIEFVVPSKGVVAADGSH